MRFKSFLFFTTVLLATMCAQSQSAQDSYGLITSAQLDSLKDANKDITLIDVRTPAEVANGTIPGAKNIDFRSSSFLTEIEKLDPNQEYVIFCAIGGRSAAACKQMRELGYTKIYNLRGGYSDYSRKINK